MCGICGIFDAEGQGPAHAALARQMSDALSHRGPDNDGFHVASHCVLGHRRLKIIDLSPLGANPMTNEDGSLWLTFNGEIYNYQDLRPELVKRGHRFRSQTDTEVILHMYEDEGEDFLQQLNGMFALALWDERRKRLILARDRFGKKPLYYWSDGRRLLFGSEIKSILADPRVPREIDPDAVSAYCSLGYVPAPASIFRNIFKLPAASYLVVERGSDGRVRLRGPHRYWQLRYEPNPALADHEDACVARIRELISDSVRIRMYSDVPLGAFLSGGLDSSTVVAAMSQAASRPVEAFSIAFDEESFNEIRYAELVAKKFGANHHTFRCTPDALEALPALVHHFDEPFADSSAIPTYYVSKIAREHVTVALSGDGGDEVFAGYTRYENGMRDEQRRNGALGGLRRGLYAAVAAAYPRGLRGWGYFYRNSLGRLPGYASSMSVFQPPEKASLWSADFAQHVRAAAKMDDTFGLYAAHEKGAMENGGAPDALTAMQYVDQMLYLPDDILVKVDRASMAVSLETRAPLLDYRLAEFLATIPAELRYRNGTKKYLLRRAVEGVLPAEIIERGKQGFTVPLQNWFSKAAGDFAYETLTSSKMRVRGIFNPEEVDRLLAIRERRTASEKIWTVLFFEMWCRRWLDQAPASAPSAEVTCLAG